MLSTVASQPKTLMRWEEWVGGWWVGGWSDKTKLILISTLVEVVVEVEVELGKNHNTRAYRQGSTKTRRKPGHQKTADEVSNLY